MHVRLDDESFWRLHPSKTDYLALGHIFHSAVTSDGSFKAPDLTTDSLKTLRGIRKDLCEKATLESKPEWTNAGQSGGGWVSVFKPARILSHLVNLSLTKVAIMQAARSDGPAVENLYHFMAFSNSGDADSAKKNAQSEIYMLKSDSIYIEPWN
ncbi:hypothetical protein HGRIS_005424 [Hohenbuehelia grisea]|uniref:Uncharacterized protein n=1 Tax=Hohenbuehelia grisea TaxID=104357 RepID=A0ABR3JYK1_9AGAR